LTENTIKDYFSVNIISYFRLIIKEKSYIPLSFFTLFETSRLNVKNDQLM